MTSLPYAATERPDGDGARSPDVHQDRTLRSMARGGAAAFAGTGAAAVLGFVLTVVVTRALAPDDAGAFFSSIAIFFVLQALLAFGVGAGVVRGVPRLRALNRQDEVPALLVTALVPIVILSATAAATLVLAAPLVARQIGWATTTDVRLLGVFLVPAVVEVFAVESTRAFRRVNSYVLIQMLGLPLARPVLVAGAIALHGGHTAALLAWLTPIVPALVAAASVLYRALAAEFGGWRSWPWPHGGWRAIAREYWSFTAVRGAASSIDIALTWLDVVLVAALVTPADAAVYAAASRFITSGTLVMAALRLVTSPELSSALAAGDVAAATRLYRVATQWVVFFSWPLYLLLAIFASTVLRLFGSHYVDGSAALSVLCLAMLVSTAAGNVGSVLLMGGRSSWVFWDKVAVLVVYVTVDLTLIPRWGILGAAVTWAIAIVLDSSLATVQVRRWMSLRASLRGLAVAAALTASCVAVPGAAVRLVGWSGLPVMLMVTLAGGVLLLLGGHRFRRPLDLDALVGAFRAPVRGTEAPSRPAYQKGGSVDHYAGR